MQKNFMIYAADRLSSIDALFVELIIYISCRHNFAIYKLHEFYTQLFICLYFLFFSYMRKEIKT
jgi:hypothetical protein